MSAGIATGYAQDVDAVAAVAGCADQLGAGEPDLIIAFVGGRHVPDAVLAALRTRFGALVPILGGSAAGVIATAGYGYSGYEMGLIAFRGPAVTPLFLTDHALLKGEREAGRNLGAATRARTGDGALVLLMFDSVAQTEPLRLHPASLLVEGFTEGLGSRQLQLVGGGLLTDINMSGGWMFDGVGVCRHAAVALVFPAGITASTAILHGCRPVSSFLTITRVEGPEVFELDGRPALATIEGLLGLELGTTSGQQLSLVATLGQKQGDPFAPYDENAYVNRLILHANPDAGSITLFEPDFTVGTRVQIMSRDNGLMLDSVVRGVYRLRRDIAHADCILGLYIDCAGRASVMTGSETEEAELVLQSLQAGFPVMGFYSGVEVAPFAGGYSRPLDWTGVLTIIRHAA